MFHKKRLVISDYTIQMYDVTTKRCKHVRIIQCIICARIWHCLTLWHTSAETEYIQHKNRLQLANRFVERWWKEMLRATRLTSSVGWDWRERRSGKWRARCPRETSATARRRQTRPMEDEPACCRWAPGHVRPATRRRISSPPKPPSRFRSEVCRGKKRRQSCQLRDFCVTADKTEKNYSKTKFWLKNFTKTFASILRMVFYPKMYVLPQNAC